MLRRSFASELLDKRAYCDADELRSNLRDMARYDRWLGVFTLAVRLATTGLPPHGLRTGLDVGCGSGDFIIYARRAGVAAHWWGVDLSYDVLRIALSVHPHIVAVCAEGVRLPFADGSVDVVTAIHLLHHLDPPQAISLLRECKRVARLRVVCVDLARGVGTLVGAWVLTRLTSRNRLTRADGVLSVQRAYTPAEAAELARQAGWPDFSVQKHGPSRYSLTLVCSFAQRHQRLRNI